MHATRSPSGAAIAGSALTLWILAGLVMSCGTGLAAPAPVATLTFDEEFTSFVSSPDGSAGWMTSFPGQNRSLWSNHDGEWYSDSSVGVNPFSLTNGILGITAAPAGPGDAPDGLQYTSGIITTYTSFSQLYGVFSLRAKLPAGQGLWPAFWLLPASNQYTSELDVFEVLGQTPGTDYVSTIGADKTGAWASNTQALQVADTSDGFHVYKVDWGPREIVFLIDDKVVARSPTPASMNTPMYMIINLAVGGEWSWPGTPNATTLFPATMQLDWVRAYSTKYTKAIAGTRAIIRNASAK